MAVHCNALKCDVVAFEIESTCVNKRPKINSLQKSIFFSQLFIKFVFLTIFYLLFCPLASSEPNEIKQREILLKVMNVDGWIDESDHQNFWELMPLEVQRDPHAISLIISELDRVFLVATRFQRNVWMSAQKSLKAQQVIKVAGYQELEQKILSLLPTEDYIDQSRVAIENANNLLTAAAYQTPMNVHGVPRYITEEMIDSVLSGIEGSLDRIARLFNPIWNEEINEYVFDDAHVRILWHGSFRKEVGQYTVENGGRATVISLSHQMSELDSVGVNFVRSNARWAVPAASAISTASSSLRAIGISEPDVLASRWRSRVAAKGAGSTNTADGMIFASVRIVEAPEFDGFWQILAVSGASTLEALRLREKIESSLQLVAGSR